MYPKNNQQLNKQNINDTLKLLTNPTTKKCKVKKSVATACNSQRH